MPSISIMKFVSTVYSVALIYLSFHQLHQFGVNGQCAGCSSFASCDVTFVDNAVYGCGGIWEDAGVSNGEYLCGENYTICSNYTYAEVLGLTYDLCMSTDLFPDNLYFYVIDQSSSGSLVCDNSGTNDIFGCASTNDTGRDWLYIDASIDCGPFGASMSTSSYGTSWLQGWEIGSDGSSEFSNTYHLYTQESDGSGGYTRTTTAVGGVMCCSDFVPDTTDKPTAVPTIPPTPDTDSPTMVPTEATDQPSMMPTEETNAPSKVPSDVPTATLPPTNVPTEETEAPSRVPTEDTDEPSMQPSMMPTEDTDEPSMVPTKLPTPVPSEATDAPTKVPSMVPSGSPTMIDDSDGNSTMSPSASPTASPAIGGNVQNKSDAYGLKLGGMLFVVCLFGFLFV